MAATLPRLLDVSPFSEKNLFELGSKKNWPELRRIIRPLEVPGFAVVDIGSQAQLDGARLFFDSSVGGDLKRNVLHQVAANDSDGVGHMLEQLLSVGMDPDLEPGDKWRPSHSCAYRGHLRATRALLLCRPDMQAKNVNGDTLLGAAQKIRYKDDDKFPHRAAKRQDVVKLIHNEEPFKKLAELALRELWFAVKNLVRRQVIPASEYQEKASGKTAAEWAEHFGQKLMAQELEYYATLPSARLLDSEIKNKILQGEVRILEGKLADANAAKAKVEKQASLLNVELLLMKQEVKDLDDKLAAERKVVDGLKNELSKKEAAIASMEEKANTAEVGLKKQVDSLEERCASYEKKNRELSETITALTSRSPGGESKLADQPGAKRPKLQMDKLGL